ncbi:MAG: hypothetical protein Q9196_006418 [Gyalolechia fulgens]
MAKRIVRIIQEMHREHEEISSILFTGHSAGGAIAQLFFAMSMSPDTTLSKGISKDFQEVHCITFGTPPITTTPLHDWQGDSKRHGVFLSIVNEGDPVPQAQEEFIKTLIDVYVLSRNDLDIRYPNGVEIPHGLFRASGHQVILRDADPDDLDSNNIEVYTTESSVLEKKLFGNPFVHPMKEYLDRIEGLGDLGLK